MRMFRHEKQQQLSLHASRFGKFTLNQRQITVKFELSLSRLEKPLFKNISDGATVLKKCDWPALNVTDITAIHVSFDGTASEQVLLIGC